MVDVRVGTVAKIAAALGVRPRDLFDGGEAAAQRKAR
jgi:hypothetical protein